eukprot:5240524-Pyramimonas_sp.AAC.1
MGARQVVPMTTRYGPRRRSYKWRPDRRRLGTLRAGQPAMMILLRGNPRDAGDLTERVRCELGHIEGSHFPRALHDRP